jgi:hypothetical protein
MTIWKYELNTEIRMPKGAIIISTALQNGSICIWAMVEPENPKETRRFAALQTGEQMAYPVHNYVFVGTILETQNYVLHIFEYLPNA